MLFLFGTEGARSKGQNMVLIEVDLEGKQAVDIWQQRALFSTREQVNQSCLFTMRLQRRRHLGNFQWLRRSDVAPEERFEGPCLITGAQRNVHSPEFRHSWPTGLCLLRKRQPLFVSYCVLW